jgi:hypothetical protein
LQPEFTVLIGIHANLAVQKALNIYNAALVTPTYYVYFTSSTIVASAVLFQGFHGTAIQIVDVVMGFLVICSGVVLLQLAKSSKDVPDVAVFKGDLDQVRTVAEVEEPEYEPRADTIRGGAGIVRAMSRVRTKRQADEVKRMHEERMEPIGEGEEVEWDGLRRRKTISSGGTVKRTKTIHPPLGLTHFPDDDNVSEPDSEVHPGFFGRIGRKRHTTALSNSRREPGTSPVPLASVPRMNVEERGDAAHDEDTAYKGYASTHITFAGDVHDPRDRATSGSSSLAPPQPPPHTSGGSGAKRQFSFQNVFHRKRSDATADDRPTSRGALSFISGRSREDHSYPSGAGGTTEEERMGLVHGDSSNLPKYSEVVEDEPADLRDSDEWQVTSGTSSSPHDVTGDLGMGSRDRGRRDPYDDDFYDDDEFYDEPLEGPEGKDDPHDNRGWRRQ